MYTVNLKQALDLCFKFTDLYNYQILEERVPPEHQSYHSKIKDLLVLKLASQIAAKAFHKYNQKALHAIVQFKECC